MNITTTSMTVDLAHLIKTMSEALVDFPSEIKIEIIVDQPKFRAVISSNMDDKRRLIGKNGVTINAMRTVVHNALAKYGFKADIYVLED